MKDGRVGTLGFIISFNFFLLLAVIIGFLCPADFPVVPIVNSPLVEFGAFFWLSMMLIAVFMPLPLVLIGLLAALSLIAGLYEFAQVWTPFRDGRVLDWMGNVLALTLGAIAGLWMAKVMARLLPEEEK